MHFTSSDQFVEANGFASSMVKLLRGHRTPSPAYCARLVLALAIPLARRSELPLQAAILAGAYPGFLDGVGRYFKSEKHSPRPHASAFRTALAVTSSRRIARLKVRVSVPGVRMKTREILLKADRIVLALERLEGGKIRAVATSWDDAKVISPNQVLEVAVIGKQVRLVQVDKPVAYLDIDDTGLVEAGYGPVTP